MVGPADFGIGLASGAAVDIAKALLEYARVRTLDLLRTSLCFLLTRSVEQDIRANKRSVNELALYCRERTQSLADLIQDASSLGKLTPEVEARYVKKESVLIRVNS